MRPWEDWPPLPLKAQDEEPQTDRRRGTYRLPRILPQIVHEENLHRLPSAPDELTIVAPFINPSGPYDITFSEDSTFLTLDAEVGRVKAKPSPEFVSALHEINARTTQAKLIYEADTLAPDGTTCSSVQLSKQIRKRGVPETTLLAEIASFDQGVARARGDLEEVARMTHTELLSGNSDLVVERAPEYGLMASYWENLRATTDFD